ncbi:MAG: hypothetical protein IT370_10825 [Deltaproteobacteria bacterium]|nr:hypothetical protein [Deltaproteobacteria bacterium]
MRALLMTGMTLTVLTGVAQAGKTQAGPPLAPPAIQQGCGADGKLTPELARLKLPGANNLQPCQPGSIIFVDTLVKKKKVVGFVAIGPGYKVGRVYVAGTPADDTAALTKLIPKKPTDADLINLLTAALLLSKNLSYENITWAPAPAPQITARAHTGAANCGATQTLTIAFTKNTLTLTSTPAPGSTPCR